MRFGAAVLFDSDDPSDRTAEATREFETLEELLGELRLLLTGTASWRLVTICRPEDLPALMADATPEG